MRRALGRLARMDAAEVRFRVSEAVRAGSESIRFAAGMERWRPEALAASLRPDSPALADASAALRAGRLREAEAALQTHFRDRASRFPLDPQRRQHVASGIHAAFPGAAADACRRADRLLERRYDLLGYADLSFRSRLAETDWHLDPVHGRRAPVTFWRRVRFLDPRIGDHKIIWELNRHQHWLSLGRAAWLSGDARYSTAIARELREWMAANPPLAGVNWASMLELGLRSISWIWALHFLLGRTPDDSAGNWATSLLSGLDRQLDHVARHLSIYFSPNTHLLGEALALYVGGRVMPELRRAPQWANTGRALLRREAHRQVLDDGGHAERSTHYHRYALDFYLLALAVARRTGDAAAEDFAGTASRMADYCRAVADDRGRLARVGDDDGGALFPICRRDVADASDSLSLAAALLGRPELAVSDATEEALWMLGGEAPVGRRPAATRPSQLFSESGYVVLRSRGVHALVDAGAHGFLNGGHAHADALAIVLTVRGIPLLIDPGTATYTMDPAARDRFRSSAMHNTVVVDGRPQSEPDGPFHWKTRAHARVDCWRSSAEFDYVEASHDGYLPLLHRRAVLATREGVWIVADHLLGDGEHRADLYWHLDPCWEPREGALVPTIGNEGDRAPFAALASTAGQIETYRGDAEGFGWCSPVYGRVTPSLTFRCAETLRLPATVATAIAVTDVRAELTVRLLPVAGETDGWHRAGVGVASGDRRFVALFATASSDRATDRRLPHHVRLEDGTFETDARLALLRFSPEGTPAALSLVDGRRARWTGASPFAIDLPPPAEDLHLDLAAEHRLSRAGELRRLG